MGQEKILYNFKLTFIPYLYISFILSHDDAYGSDILQCIKIDKPLIEMVYLVTLCNDSHNSVLYIWLNLKNRM